LSVPFSAKDEAKALGARWDATKKSWYNPDPETNKELEQWAVNMKKDRCYLAIPFSQKDKVKALGAMWDAAEKKWFNPDPVNNTELNQWKASNEEVVLTGAHYFNSLSDISFSVIVRTVKSLFYLYLWLSTLIFLR
jgi:hypothetical protein